MTDEIIVCPNCNSTRVMLGKKKCKCLDCHKSFKPEKKFTSSTVQPRFSNIESMERLVRREVYGERYGRR